MAHPVVSLHKNKCLEKTTDPYDGGEVDYGNGAGHCWNGDQENPNYSSRLRYNTMYLNKIKERLKKTAPKKKVESKKPKTRKATA